MQNEESSRLWAIFGQPFMRGFPFGSFGQLLLDTFFACLPLTTWRLNSFTGQTDFVDARQESLLRRQSIRMRDSCDDIFGVLSQHDRHRSDERFRIVGLTLKE